MFNVGRLSWHVAHCSSAAPDSKLGQRCFGFATCKTIISDLQRAPDDVSENLESNLPQHNIQHHGHIFPITGRIVRFLQRLYMRPSELHAVACESGFESLVEHATCQNGARYWLEPSRLMPHEDVLRFGR